MVGDPYALAHTKGVWKCSGLEGDWVGEGRFGRCYCGSPVKRINNAGRASRSVGHDEKGSESRMGLRSTYSRYKMRNRRRSNSVAQ
jgi:hypothetical protein